MSWSPVFSLYDAAGNWIYDFPLVQPGKNYPPHSEKSLLTKSNARGKGEIIIDGGEASWDIELNFLIIAADYKALAVIKDYLESICLLNTAYLLRVDKDQGGQSSDYWEYHVKRIGPIIYDDNSFQTDVIETKIIFRTNTW